MIDLIGDVHGHADELEELLTKLGYFKKDNYYSHPERKVVFVGDYIDRGLQIRETLEIVKQMVDHGSAIALLGNHEYNALCFHLKDSEGSYLREHSDKNIDQHRATLDQFENRQNELEMYLEWFKTLPLFFETESFRAVHACWDHKSIDYLRKHLSDDRLTDELICESVKKGTELYNAIENTLKGKEIRIPNGRKLPDKDGHPRNEMRIKWWVDAAGMTYKTISMPTNDKLPEEVVDLKDIDFYKNDEKCVFFGHYWLEGKPSLYQDNICCLDYSVAKKGILAAYRFDDELKLDEQKFVYV